MSHNIVTIQCLQLRGNENFCVFEMKAMDIMLYIYDNFNILTTILKNKFIVYDGYNTIQYATIL